MSWVGDMTTATAAGDIARDVQLFQRPETRQTIGRRLMIAAVRAG